MDETEINTGDVPKLRYMRQILHVLNFVNPICEGFDSSAVQRRSAKYTPYLILCHLGV